MSGILKIVFLRSKPLKRLKVYIYFSPDKHTIATILLSNIYGKIQEFIISLMIKKILFSDVRNFLQRTINFFCLSRLFWAWQVLTSQTLSLLPCFSYIETEEKSKKRMRINHNDWRKWNISVLSRPSLLLGEALRKVKGGGRKPFRMMNLLKPFPLTSHERSQNYYERHNRTRTLSATTFESTASIPPPSAAVMNSCVL